jgi:hypothetical protein
VICYHGFRIDDQASSSLSRAEIQGILSFLRSVSLLNRMTGPAMLAD